MSKNYLKTKNKKIQFIQGLLGEIHEEISFSARDHKYKVLRDVLTKDGVVQKEVSPFSVSSFVTKNFEHFNEKNWDIPASRSGISKEDLIYNRLLAQVMGCVKGSIIHDYLENFAKGSTAEPDENLAEVIRTETKYNFYPLHKESNNFIRRLNRNIDFGKHDDLSIQKDVFKTFPDFPKGTLALELTNLKNINNLILELSNNLEKINSKQDLINTLKKDFNFPENLLNEFNDKFSNKEITKENIFETFSEIEDNEFFEKKEFLYKCSLISLSNSCIELNNFVKNNDPNLMNEESFILQKQILQSNIRDKTNTLNQIFLLNPEVTAKTIQELKAEEYRLNKDINVAVKEVFNNLNAGNMIEKLKDKGIEIIAVEQKMSVGGVIGTSDLIISTEDGQIGIADYKTNKGNLSPSSLWHYSYQLEVYQKMIHDLIRNKIENNPIIQKKVEKLWGMEYKKAVDNIICKPSNPILLHISSVDKIKDNDISSLKALGLRDILKNIKSMEFSSNIEKTNFFNKEINNLNKKIESLVKNVDSCKLIYTPEYCTQYRDNNKIDYKIIDLVNETFENKIIEVREPKNHIYSTDLNLIVPDTENNRKILINDLKIEEREQIIKKLDNSFKSQNKIENIQKKGEQIGIDI